VAFAYEYDKTFMSLLQEVYASGNDAVTLNNSSPYTTNSVLCLRATSIMTVETVQNVSCKQPLRVLFDSACDVTLWNRRALPKGVQPEGGGAVRSTSIHGTKWMDQSVLCTELCFPELSATSKVEGPVRATIFDNPESSYDVIIGMDLLQALGIDVLNSTKTIQWGEHSIPFKPANYFSQSFSAESFYCQAEDDLFEAKAERPANATGYKSKVILHSKYEKQSPYDVAMQQKHLSFAQRQQLATVFSKYEKLFSGKLDKYPYKKVHFHRQCGCLHR